MAPVAVGRRVSFTSVTPHCIFLLIALISASRSMAVTNVLLSGQTLSKQGRLSYEDSGISLIMQLDCNLVTYDGHGNALWHTNTAGRGSRECVLSFTDKGQLVVRNPRGQQMWISSNANSPAGNYVTVLRPDGVVSIFGPVVWSTAASKESVGIGSKNSSEIAPPVKNLKNKPFVYNLIFSGQSLYDNGKLTDNGYSFIMNDDCELALQNSNGIASWRTWTKGNGKYCFARLNHKGRIYVKDDDYKTIWHNWVSETTPVGEYVLLLQQNGEAVIYGPEVWTNKRDKSGLIQMPTSDK